MKFTLKNSKEFGWEGLKGFVYNTKEDFPRASAAFIEVAKRHGKGKSLESDKIYFVVSGKGRFEINGTEFLVEKNDVVIVPKNAVFDYEGRMKLFLVLAPAFNQKTEVKLE